MNQGFAGSIRDPPSLNHFLLQIPGKENTFCGSLLSPHSFSPCSLGDYCLNNFGWEPLEDMVTHQGGPLFNF